MSSIQDFRVKTKALSLHNEYRADHGTEPLSWSYELAKAAKEHSELLSMRRDGKPLTQMENVGYGQNIYEVQWSIKGGVPEVSETEAIERAMKSWYQEINEYNWINPPGSKPVLSFTQILWRDTKKLGVGVAKSGEKIVVVAFYDPNGNFRGEFQANVLSRVTPYRSTATLSQPSRSSEVPTPRKSSPTRVSFADQVKKPSEPKETMSNGNLKLGSVPKILSTAVDLQNHIRMKHRSSALQLDPKLCLQAQNYAQAIVDGVRPPPEPSNVSRNVFRFSGSMNESMQPVDIIRKAVTKWYDGKVDHNWSTPSMSGSNARPFQNMVWKSATQIGVGFATLDNLVVVTALYSPVGNTTNEQNLTDNVRRALY